MPGIDSYAFLVDLTRRSFQDNFCPFLRWDRSVRPEVRERAFGAGAKDFLPKPIDVEEFLLHVHALLDTRFAHLRLQETRVLLEDLVQRRTSELKQAQLETLELLGRVAEVRDDATGQHTKRVGRLSGLIAQELHLPPEQVELIMRAAPLHDLGKVAIADSILLKNGSFEEVERESMRRHAALGAELLEGARSELLRIARNDRGLPSRALGRARIPLRVTRGQRFLSLPASSRWPTLSTPSPTLVPTRKPGRPTRPWPRSSMNEAGSSTRRWWTPFLESTSASARWAFPSDLL